MTKAEEIQHLKYFVDGLPRDSYIRDALEPFLLEFERWVYSDYVPTVLESWRHRTEAEEEAKEARKQLATVEAEIKQAKARLRNYCVSVGTLLDRAKNLQQCIDNGVETLREVHNSADSLYERTANL